MAKKYKVRNGRFGEHDAGAKLSESEVTESGWNLDDLLARGVIVEINSENEEVAYVPKDATQEATIIAVAEAEVRAIAAGFDSAQAPNQLPTSEEPVAPRRTASGAKKDASE